MEPTPRSLILDLLGTVGRRAAPVKALLAAGEVFGIGGNRLRVALARLCGQGLVERQPRGHYRLGSAARAVNEEIRAWPRIEDRLRPWDGDWVAVRTTCLPAGSARVQRDRERARRLLGFRALDADLELRPDNLVGGTAAVRARLAALGVEAPGLVFSLRDLDPAADADARDRFDPEGVRAGYRSLQATLEASSARLEQLPRDAAMAESFRIGGAAIRRIVLDPLLPEAIVPGEERRRLIACMREYDRRGRAIWSGWLGEPSSEALPLPAGVAPQAELATLEGL